MKTLHGLTLVWLGLLGALALEAAGGRLLHFGMASLALGVAMAATVAAAFMHANEGPPPIRLFIWFGGFWLLVLLTLGLMDPLTRVNHALPAITLR